MPFAASRRSATGCGVFGWKSMKQEAALKRGTYRWLYCILASSCCGDSRQIRGRNLVTTDVPESAGDALTPMPRPTETQDAPCLRVFLGRLWQYFSCRHQHFLRFNSGTALRGTSVYEHLRASKSISTGTCALRTILPIFPLSGVRYPGGARRLRASCAMICIETMRLPS